MPVATCSTTFDIFNGAIQSKQADGTTQTKTLTASGKPTLVNSEITEWAVAHDRTNFVSYIRTYGGSVIQKIDHKAIDFGQPGLRTIELQNEFGPEDITSNAQPLAAGKAE